jgi:hemerythrin-like domain-containing protein
VIQLGAKPETVAEQPLEHLIACHRRILHRLDVLERIGAALADDPASAIAALRNTIRFFDVTARLHTEDEERSLFPRLRTRLAAADREYVDALESEHRDKEEVFAELRSVAEGLFVEVTPELALRYRELVGRLCALYRSHIASEDDVLVRLGRDVLSAADLEKIREEMLSRRR